MSLNYSKHRSKPNLLIQHAKAFLQASLSVLDAHNDELKIRRMYLLRGKGKNIEFIIETNGEPEI